MRNGKLRGLLITVMLLVFLAGLASILYPYIWGAAVDSSIASTAKDFLEREEPELPATTVIIDSIKPEKVKPYPELWEDMVRYNQNIAAQGQSGLSCAYDYQKASFHLVDYGLPDEIFGVLSIPAIDLEMPIYLGATEKHMAVITLEKILQKEKAALLLCVEDLIPLLSIGRNTAYCLVRTGQIRSIRIGRKYRIPREAVTEYISRCL